MTSPRIITWATHKVADGFEYRVYSFGRGRPKVTYKTGVVGTRARAVYAARKYWRIFREADELGLLVDLMEATK